MNKLLVLDEGITQDLIRERKRKGIDRYDEVWDGVYVMPSMPTLAHQKLVHGLSTILDAVVVQPGRGEVYPGVNVSDRRTRWKENYRVPDVVVILKGGKAADCNTHVYGGPDFLIEIESPHDDTDEKIPFYSQVRVQELLIIHRDTRRLRLFRHDGNQLMPVGASGFQGGQWLLSEVLPLAFRRKGARGGARTEVQRTDGSPGKWVV